MATRIHILVFFILISHVIHISGQTCVPDAAATSDSVPNTGTIPNPPTVSTESIDTNILSADYFLYPFNYDDGSGLTDYHSYNATSFINNELTFSYHYGYDNTAQPCDWDSGSVAYSLDGGCWSGAGWGATLFPSNNRITNNMQIPPFSKLYNSYDHADVWYTVSFDFRSHPTNQWNDEEGISHAYIIRVIFFDMDKLDTYWFPNNYNEHWLYWPYFGVNHYNGNSTDWMSVNREVFAVELSTDSITNGIYLGDRTEENNSGDVWIAFPSTESTDWTTFDATFKFKIDDNTPGCENCYAAFFIESNVSPKWNTESSWSMRNLELKRESSNVVWEDPIISFDGEIVKFSDWRMQYLSDIETAGWSRTDCPHLWSNLYDWHDTATWVNGIVPSLDDAMITLPADKIVIIRSCSLDSLNSEIKPYQKIYIPPGGSLVFDDVDITLYVEEIYNDGGSIYIGNEECRLYSHINIVFVGSRSTSWKEEVSDDPTNPTKKSKGIVTTNGLINVHGKQFHPTWTRLAISVYPGDNIIYLQESVNWEVGQRIVIITSVYLDYEYNHQNEEFIINAIGDSSWTTRNVIYLGSSIRTEYHHYAGIEYQAEVLLLSRNIKFSGSQSNDKYGGHNVVNFGGSIGKFSGVEAYNMGQQNVVGRYPFHFHMIGDCPDCFVQDCSVHSSNFRCVTVHGTNEMTVTRHTSYNSYGHCLYIEDGVEENNTLSYNALTHVHPIHHSAGGSCSGETICSGCSQEYIDAHSSESNFYAFTKEELLIPSDVAASPFYAVNTYNRFVGNAASGGWSGFAFINFLTPLGKFLGNDFKDTFTNPYQRPALEFDGNIAHSSGFRWGDSGCGSCFYGGGELSHITEEGAYMYTTGRIQHDTKIGYGDNIHAWMNISNTRTYLCGIGINWWGNRVRIVNFESHDALRGAFFIGENVMRHALVNARSNNHIGSAQIGIYQKYPKGLVDERPRGGHQLYDTGVKLFLDDVIWRNFRDEPIILFLTFSNIFTPQGIAGVRNMQFDNCTHPEYYIYYDHCGRLCCDRDNQSLAEDPETQASRIYAIYDYDGSVSMSGEPTIISTHNNWWNANDDCIYHEVNENGPFLWYCPWDGRHEIGYFRLDIPGLTDGFRENPNPIVAAIVGDPEADYITGYMSQFGRNYSILYPDYPSIAGPTNMGWYFRSILGAPLYWTIYNMQIAPNNFIVLSMRYPKHTSFDVRAELIWNGVSIPVEEANSMDEIYSEKEILYSDIADYVCNDINWGEPWQWCNETGPNNNVGPKWYFHRNSGFFYIRVVNPWYYWYFRPYYADEPERSWETEGMKLWDIDYSFKYHINATCNNCDQSNERFYNVKDELPPKWPHQDWNQAKEDTNEIGRGFAIFFAVFFAILFSSTIGAMIYRYYREKNKTKQHETQIEQNQIDASDPMVDTDGNGNGNGTGFATNNAAVTEM
eukprot:58424_1